jgi:hypothetical protein
MGPLQPAGLSQVGDLQGLQHLGQAADDAVGTIGVELPEGEAPFPLIEDAQQGAGLEVNELLATAGRQQLVHLGRADGVGQQLVAEGKAAAERFEFELGGIGGGFPKPFGERVVCPGAGGRLQPGRIGECLQSRAAWAGGSSGARRRWSRTAA